MGSTRLFALALFVGLTACGGGDEGIDAAAESEVADGGSSVSESAEGGESGGSDTDGAGIVEPQPPGQALVSVDGQEYVLTDPGALACTLADDAITFSFRIGDNEVTLGAGANETDGQWLGSVDLRVADPGGEPGPIAYFPDLVTNSGGVAIDGDSFSYSGPMQKQPANDGSNPPPVDVGDGLITITCP